MLSFTYYLESFIPVHLNSFTNSPYRLIFPEKVCTVADFRHIQSRFCFTRYLDPREKFAVVVKCFPEPGGQ